MYSGPPVDEGRPPLEDFCLLVLDPSQVDHLSLKSNERQVFSKSANEEDEAWERRRVNP